MAMRYLRTSVRFANAFSLPGYRDPLPAGDYDVIAEDVRMEGLTFEAYRRMSTWLRVPPGVAGAARAELRATCEPDLNEAIRLDMGAAAPEPDGDGALSPREDET